MTGLTLKDSEVLPERDVVLEEYNMRVGNSPDARLGEQMAAALYVNHPYGRPVIGWRPEIEQLNREDALAFYKRFYAPEQRDPDRRRRRHHRRGARAGGEILRTGAGAALDPGQAHAAAGAASDRVRAP